MATRREMSSSGVDVRAHLLAKAEESDRRWGDLGVPVGTVSVWRRRTDAIRAGEDVEVHGWQLPPTVPRDPNGTYLVAGDGSITRVR